MPCLVRQRGVIHHNDCPTIYAEALGYVNKRPCEAHHIRRGAGSGIGTRPAASWTVPLCTAAHREYHDIGHDSFEKKYGINLEEHRQRINREFEKAHPAPKLKVRRVQRVRSARLALGVTHCPLCRLTHFIAWKKIDVKPRSVRFFCDRRQDYAEVPR
jgi:hypothetical protein